MFKGHGQKLSRKQAQAVTALLTESTIDKAAEQVGVSNRTLKFWLTLPSFQDALRTAQMAIVEQVVGRLVSLSVQAVETLAKNLNARSASARNRAAEILLTNARTQLEFSSLATEIVRMKAVLGNYTNADAPAPRIAVVGETTDRQSANVS